ncbi:MAG: hypothetical protein HDR96_06055 [Bacteroides sp.]|nr:hypothetical protein [Bacteroides sp.]MBD5334947.1 hypothetical protein [Bacteroides sp.]
MENKVYLIQFQYDGKEHSIYDISNADFTRETPINKNWMGMMIDNYLTINDLHIQGGKVTNARLIGDGDVCFKVDDFSEL